MKLFKFTPLLLLLLFFSCKKETIYNTIEYKATSSISGFYMEFTGVDYLNKSNVTENSVGVMPIRLESGKEIKFNISAFDTASEVTAHILVNGSKLENMNEQKIYRRIYTDSTYTDSVMVLNSISITAQVP